MSSGTPLKKSLTRSVLKRYSKPGRIEAGCDEAGRGCLAGPVFAAAVILPAEGDLSGLDDSKKLSEKRRESLRSMIEARAISYSVAMALPAEIDEINILNASFLAMHRALHKLKVSPDAILVDGNRFRPYENIPHQCYVKGDGKFQSIAAASILAKTYRDDYMRGLHQEYPVYHWDKNKGYPTREHRAAIELHGSTPHHRMSFTLTNYQLHLDFPKV